MLSYIFLLENQRPAEFSSKLPQHTCLVVFSHSEEIN